MSEFHAETAEFAEVIGEYSQRSLCSLRENVLFVWIYADISESEYFFQLSVTTTANRYFGTGTEYSYMVIFFVWVNPGDVLHIYNIRTVGTDKLLAV